ncbi:MAG: hypothetical protein QM755_03765 [Luteolibacter sp.]
MKLQRSLLLAMTGILLQNAAAQQPTEPKGLTDLRKVYETQSKSIAEKYRAALAELEKAQVRQNKVTEALATRKEIKALEDGGSSSAPAPQDLSKSPLANTKWVNRSQGECIVELLGDGTWIEHWVQHADKRGKWKLQAPPSRAITVEREGGGTTNYRLGDDGKFIYRTGDNMLFVKSP